MSGSSCGRYIKLKMNLLEDKMQLLELKFNLAGAKFEKKMLEYKLNFV